MGMRADGWMSSSMLPMVCACRVKGLPTRTFGPFCWTVLAAVRTAFTVYPPELLTPAPRGPAPDLPAAGL